MKPQNQKSNHVINRPLNGVDSVVRSTPNNNPCSSGGSQSVGADWGRKSDSIDGLMIVMNVVTAIVVVRTLNESVWVGGSNLVTVENTSCKTEGVCGNVPTDVEISANASSSELVQCSS